MCKWLTIGMCFGLIIWPSSAKAQDKSAHKTQKVVEEILPNGLKLSEYRLANGLRMLIVPDHSAPVFSFQVWFGVGSASEKLDARLNRTGLAHLFEHMMFRGTPKYPDQKFDAVISAAGAVENNATTWLDRTNYFESLPKARLELAFDVESDRMHNLGLNEKLFKTELGAVFGELTMNKDKPMRVANDMLWSTAFDLHPYKYSTMGTPEELNSFTVKDGEYFYKKYYAPNNATVILVGDVDVKQAVALAEKYYGKYKSQEIPRAEAPTEPEQTKARQISGTHPLATNEVLLVGYKTPNMNHADMATLEVISSILATGDGSLLEKSLVQTGYVASISASNYLLQYPCLFVIASQLVNGKSTEEVRKIINKTVASLRDGKLSQKELDRARNQLLLNMYGSISTNNNLGDFIGESLVSSGDYKRGFTILSEAKQVTLQDIKRVTAQYLTIDRSTQVVLSPATEKAK